MLPAVLASRPPLTEPWPAQREGTGGTLRAMDGLIATPTPPALSSATLVPAARARESPWDDLGLVHPDLLVGARGPVDPVGDAVEVVLLPQEHPRHLVVHQQLQLGPGLEALLRVHDGDGLGDLGLDGLVAAEGGVRLRALEELLDGALGVQRRPPAEEEHVPGGPVLDLVEVRPLLSHHHVHLNA